MPLTGHITPVLRLCVHPALIFCNYVATFPSPSCSSSPIKIVPFLSPFFRLLCVYENSQSEMACNIVLIAGVLMSLVMNLGDSSSVQVKWTETPPPPSVVCTYCSTCQDPCNPPVVAPPPPSPPPPQKPPQIGCPPPPAPYHYVFPPPAGVGYNPYYPYNYPYDFNLSRPPLVPRRFDLLCLAGFLVYIFL